ncbi:phage tail length tape measure family protein [Xanthobacter autotrophicus]|uniref:phage tail length tape measure family protein n=1 Tax=Xanthobacter autotrophicus TaxID=280 RepID=UPI00372B11DA
MTVQLSSLRVTAEMDVSSYTRAMADKVAADKDGAASAKAVGVALGQMDAATAKSGDLTAKLSKQLIDGYSSAAKFEKTIRDVGRAVDTGMSIDRAAIQLDNVYRKFGLVADATVLAQQGFVSIAPVVENLNQHYAEQTRLMAEQTAEAQRLAEATKAQAILEERVKAYVAAVDPATIAQERFNLAINEAEDLYTAGLVSIEQYRLGVVKAQSALDGAAVSARKAAEAQAARAQSEFNALLGVRTDFGSDTRAKDIEAWSRELDAYLTNLLRVSEAEEKVARERRVASQQAINTSLGISAPMSDTAYAARAAEYEAFGQSIDNLRAKYDPLYAAERKHAESIADINRLYAMGEVDADRYADVMRRANTVHDQTILSLKNGSAELGLNRHQWQNLGFQVNDVATMLLSGSSPMQVLATQSGQVIQIMQSGQGGVVGSLKSIGVAIVGLMTPVNLIIGGLAGMGIAAVAAYASWINAQAEVEQSLLGIGRASGATVGQINAIAEAYAAAGKVSESTARSMASAFAKTGRISPDLFGDLIASAKDFGKVVGQEGSDAAQTLAKALADPTRGAEQLNEALGAFDAGTLRRIQSLDAQNRVTEAQRILIDGIKSATEGADRATTGWSRTWDSLGQSISNVWSRLGKAIDAATGNGTIEQQKAAIEGQIALLEKARAAQAERLTAVRATSLFNFQNKEDEAALAEIDRKLQELKSKAQGFADELAKAAAEAAKVRQNLDSIKAMGEIRIVMPEIDMRKVLGDRAAYLGSISEDPIALQALGLTQKDVDLAAARAREMRDSFTTTQDAAVRQADLANKAITARSPSERAAIAAEQKKLELINAALSPQEKQVQIAQAYANALKEGTFALSEQERARVLAIDLQIGATQAEINGIGKTAEQAELLRLNWQTYSDLRRESEQNHTGFDQAQYDRLTKQNEALAKRNQLLREAQLANDLKFETDQLGRTSIDQAVASRLRAAGMPVDMNSETAAAIRYVEEMKQARDITAEFASSFVTDLSHGVSVLDALSNALTRLADKLVQMATEQLVAQAFGGLLGSGAGGGGLLSGLLGGGSTGTVGSTTGAVYVAGSHGGGVPGAGEASFYRLDHPALYANAPRYHTGRDPYGLLAGERRAIIKDNEGVFTHEQMRAMGARMTGGVTTSFSPTFNIDAKGANMTAEQIQSAIIPVLQKWRQQVLKEAPAAVEKARSKMLRSHRT